jgi:hypothetical protein
MLSGNVIQSNFANGNMLFANAGGLGWTLQGSADFNGDTNPDYVLYQASTQRTALWYLNGPAYVSSVYGPTLAAGYVLASP